MGIILSQNFFPHTIQMQILQYTKKTDILKNTIKLNELFASNLKKSIDRIIEFAYKAKFLDKTPQLQKRDLSPNCIIVPDKRKRYNKTIQNEVTNPHKTKEVNNN